MSADRRQLLCTAAAVVPPLFLAIFIAWHHVDIPFWDQWDLIPMLEKSYSGSLGWQDFWGQNNEDRMLFYHALWIPMARLSSWSHGLELVANFLVCLGSFLLFLRWFSRGTASIRQPLSRWMGFAFSALFFSGIQWENWFEGVQLSYFLNLAAVIAGFIALGRSARSPRWALAALPLALIAAGTTANGLLVLPIGALLICIALRGRRRLLLAALCLLASLILLAGMLIDYHTPVFHPSPGAALNSPIEYLRYVLNFLGAPLIKDPRLAAVLGAAGLLLFGWLARRGYRHLGARFELLAPLFGIGLYAIGSALLIGIGRVGFGSAQAVTSRYTTWAMLLWISLIGLLYLLPGLESPAPEGRPEGLAKSGSGRSARLALGAILLLACLSSAAGYLSAWRWLPWRMGAPLQAILEERNDQALLGRIYHHPGRLPAKLKFLKQHRLSLYRDLPP